VIMAPAVASRHNPNREAAPLREPANHQPNDADIDNAGANAAEQAVSRVKADQAVGIGRRNPAEAGKGGTKSDHQLGAEPVDQIALYRRKEGLQNDHRRERDLHGRERGVGRCLERLDEQGPNVLGA
jgi:hypothetical protein